jgi:hypothetical protein
MQYRIALQKSYSLASHFVNAKSPHVDANEVDPKALTLMFMMTH